MSDEDHPQDSRDQRVWLGRHNGRPELRSRSRRVARISSWLLAVVITTTLLVWGWNSWRLLDPCVRIAPPGSGCSDPDPPLPMIQFVIAVAGILMGSAVLVYLLRLATTGLTWRRWRVVAVAFGLLVVAWTVVFAVGAAII